MAPFLEQLEKGNLPWRSAWPVHFNPSTGQHYSAMSVFLGQWGDGTPKNLLTSRQAEALGARIIPGEESDYIPSVYFSRFGARTTKLYATEQFEGVAASPLENDHVDPGELIDYLAGRMGLNRDEEGRWTNPTETELFEPFPEQSEDETARQWQGRVLHHLAYLHLQAEQWELGFHEEELSDPPRVQLRRELLGANLCNLAQAFPRQTPEDSIAAASWHEWISENGGAALSASKQAQGHFDQMIACMGMNQRESVYLSARAERHREREVAADQHRRVSAPSVEINRLNGRPEFHFSVRTNNGDKAKDKLQLTETEADVLRTILGSVTMRKLSLSTVSFPVGGLEDISARGVSEKPSLKQIVENPEGYFEVPEPTEPARVVRRKKEAAQFEMEWEM
jgi:hypothetical protein